MILDLGTIKLVELFEDAVFTHCNRPLFVLVKRVKIISQTQSPPFYLTSPVDGGIPYLLSLALHTICPVKIGMHNVQLNSIHQASHTTRTF